MNINKPNAEIRIKVTKLDAARRQLESAIVSYFNGGDPVPIHTLATSAREILSNLNTHRGGKPMYFDLEVIKPEYRKELRKKFRAAQNFFKHADNDPNGILNFYPESSIMSSFKMGLLGRKLGMTQVFHDDGTSLGCTALAIGPCVVTSERVSRSAGSPEICSGLI